MHTKMEQKVLDMKVSFFGTSIHGVINEALEVVNESNGKTIKDLFQEIELVASKSLKHYYSV